MEKTGEFRKLGGAIIGAFLGALVGGYYSGYVAFGLVFGGAWAMAWFLEILFFRKNFLFFVVFWFISYSILLSYFDITIPETISGILTVLVGYIAGTIILGILWTILFSFKSDSKNTKKDGQ
ncbi:MAG: hypothetical protein A3G49_05475 [Candidatus Sungbacteria bacterium RIFCSPLOWO2_12_FULL_41_11]|uniref:Uncharacterized protein n=1 Tax=Candidatus Sungbacteria bacterium RIFCSPLOWO2_12_FULL_41_11 TaxID=1802286 RepID=A0A1G2LUR9_9BACT|nr:MAG: hypothetical protein UV01_C0008G0054 [Parcubacteria group bacterium GW2011_GWA2_42_14]OHA14612.1 MAG: hypothetical protein A3G49_05475 [Candidatus Sungbacteria bacterium RIFCSPLOWO2_12_FULL_41_11]